MGVLSLDSYTRQKFKGATRYYKPGQKIPGKFKSLILDANPFVYTAAMRAFEYGDYDTVIRENDDLTYDEKIQLIREYTWEEIKLIISVVDSEEVFIAFDGCAPCAKQAQQRQRRYPRPLPEKGSFDATNISTGTEFLYDLCSFIKFKIQEAQLNRKIIFSGQGVPGEGEHKGMDYIRQFKAGTRVIMFGPDGDLIMLGLASYTDFFLFKIDHRKRNDYDQQYYTIRMNCIKPQIASWTRGIHKFDATKSFVFLGSFLGNDFVPRLEIFDLFISGIDDMYSRYKKLRKPIINKGRMDKVCFTDLLYLLADEEAELLAQRRKHSYPLLEKHLDKGKLDFKNFRKEYYRDWLEITHDEDIKKLCFNYLDTIWWTWMYYTRGCPSFSHHYKYHYPPFCTDLAKYSRSWRIPRFEKVEPRTPFHQLCAILPPNRKHLLPKKYHHIFKGESFPKLKHIKVNVQGKNAEFETIYEVPFFSEEIDVIHKHYHARNRVEQDRVFELGEDEWEVETKWGKIITKVQG
jgi:5'-3' exonuclease